ncbi:unnamed protein product [Brachionus calyciflorus]|uniref:Coiled-coil domain-containing protein 87 n=1 Tax=Brachionus calyciflorus TaxID=104777 RepID=A0A813QN77_9BILA|nr:unnamed protein product [Brachionus calyciflorus]
MYFSEQKVVSNSLNKFGLYELQDFSTYEQDLKNNYHRVIKPMLSNASNPIEEEQTTFIPEELIAETEISLNELIKREPNTIEEFIDLMRSRFTTKPDSCLDEKDQEELIRICILEAKFKWKEMKRGIENPFLNHEENIELRRRIFVNVISICEKLYKHYCDKADILKNRKIFSHEANFSRLKTLMANDVKKFLNIHFLKHHLANFLRSNQRVSSKATQSSTSIKPLNLKRITTKDLIDFTYIDFRNPRIENFQTKQQSSKSKRFKTTREHLKEIQDSMPILETKHLTRLLKTLPKKQEMPIIEKSQTFSNTLDDDDSISYQSTGKPVDDETLLEQLKNPRLKRKLKKKRSKSISYFHELSLLEELNLDLKSILSEKNKTTDSLKLSNHERDKKQIDLTKKKLNFADFKKFNEKQLALKLKQDLDNLTMEIRRKEAIKDHDDDYLLMTLMSKPNLKERMKEIKEKMKTIDRKYKQFLEEIKLPVNDETNAFVQPATFETKIYNNLPIRLSDVRVSNRVLRYNITIKPYGPLYNDISGEIDSMMIQHLDRNLFIGGEVKEVYDELIKTISEDHLRFDLDDFVQKAPNSLKYEGSYTSSLLVKYGKTKSINNTLITNDSPPWKQMDYREWNKTPLIDPVTDLEPGEVPQLKANGKKIPSNLKPMDIKPEKIELYKHSDPTTYKNKEFKVWINWWQTYFSSEDYFKYLSTQTSDYLGLIFHLFDQDYNPILLQTDEEIKLLKEKEKADKEREEIIENLKKQKFAYEPGVWNPDSILLGGLGKEPKPDENEDPILNFKKNLENSRPKSYKIQFFKGDKEDKDEVEEARTQMLEMLREKKQESPQDRLERVWTLLRMSDTAKLDMAIKYSTSSLSERLIEAIEDWEVATNLIVEREKYIYELENFERFASDPNRFFLKGFKGSSAARLEEALKRENLYKLIENLQTKIESVVKLIEKKYKDVITYNSRPYLEKMKWDRIEMLHWLTEERRRKYFKNEIRMKQLKTTLVEL